MLCRVFGVLGCALFIPGDALFIPRGRCMHPYPALIIPRVGLNWSPGMNRSLYLIFDLQFSQVVIGKRIFFLVSVLLERLYIVSFSGSCSFSWFGLVF